VTFEEAGPLHPDDQIAVCRPGHPRLDARGRVTSNRFGASLDVELHCGPCLTVVPADIRRAESAPSSAVLAVMAPAAPARGRDPRDWWRARFDGRPRPRLSHDGVSWRSGRGARLSPWRHRTTAEAVNELCEARLVPDGWCDPAVGPRWRCPCCGGMPACPKCGGSGLLEWPGWYSDVIGVASLGAAPLARAERIADDVWRGRRVVWCPENARYLETRNRLEHSAPSPHRDPALCTFMRAAAEQRWSENAWPERCPYGDGEVGRAWPALREFARLGVHLIGLRPAEVHLAVPADY